MKIPFKGNGNSVVCAYRLGELKLYRNSMINYFKSNDYKLSQNLKSLFYLLLTKEFHHEHYQMKMFIMSLL